MVSKEAYIIGDPIRVWAINSLCMTNIVLISIIMSIILIGSNLGSTTQVVGSLIVFTVSIKLTLSIMVDIMYIVFPFIRTLKIFSNIDNLVSVEAKYALKVEGDTKLGYLRVKEPDRIKRDLELLANMQNIYPNSTRLKEIQQDLELYKRSKRYYYTIAQIEFIYDRIESGDKSVLNIKTKQTV